MPGIKLNSGFVLNPGGVETPLTFGAGDSNVVFLCPDSSEIFLISAWHDIQVAGYSHIRSPKMHDNVLGVRMDSAGTDWIQMFPIGIKQKLYPFDTLQCSINSTAGAGVYETMSFLIYYSDLPGINARLALWSEIQSRIKNIVIVPIDITPGVLSDYSGELIIINDFDPFKGDTDYVLLGYETQADVCSVRWRGPDLGNLGIGGPCKITADRNFQDWFIQLSSKTNLPTIPIISSSNKFNTYVDVFGNDNSAALRLNQIFGELSSA